MTKARIYSPARTAMQSGKGKAGRWVLEFERQSPRRIEPLMGYTSSSDTQTQVRMRFDTLEAAIAYADRHGIAYEAEGERKVRRRAMSYSENFGFGRKMPWTH